MYKKGTCWDGYVQKGMKKKGNKMVPNCVPAGKMKTGGLTKWFQEKWVDIGAKKKGGKFQECGRKSASSSKRKYPKCVPAAKAAAMSKSQRASAVRRKRAVAQGVGGKPTNVKTLAKGDVVFVDKGKEYGISKREIGIHASKGDRQASKALKKMKNKTFIYPDKILRERT